MSYKSFEKIKEHVEIEAIKKMNPNEINDALKTLSNRIKLLERQLEAARLLVDFELQTELEDRLNKLASK